MVRSEIEIKELKDKLDQLTGFIYDYGSDEDVNHKELDFACNLSDALSWVLEEIPTDNFKSDNYLDIENLKIIANNIENRTGNKLDDYD